MKPIFNFWRPSRIRLYADMKAYIFELEKRYPGFNNLLSENQNGAKPAGKEALYECLAESIEAVKNDNLEIAWRLFNKSKQIEILCKDEKDKSELIGLAHKFYNEADKTNLHRAKSVKEILSFVNNGENKVKPAEKQNNSAKESPGISFEKLRSDVFQAAKIIGEHYDNEGYKSIIRAQSYMYVIILLLIILIAIPVLFGYNCLPLLNATSMGEPCKGFLFPTQLFSCEILGMFGALFSIVVSYTRTPIVGNIPKQKVILQTTYLRPLIGAASGIALYILFNAGFFDDQYQLAIYALAFASGFSERVILNSLSNIAGETKAPEKA